MSTSGSRAASSTIGAPFAFDAFDRRRLDSAFAVANSLLEGWRTIGDAWMGFTRSQIEGNLALLQSLAQCQDPMTALSLQIDGAQATMSRCITTATKTSDIATRIATEALAPLQPQATQRAA